MNGEVEDLEEFVYLHRQGRVETVETSGTD